MLRTFSDIFAHICMHYIYIYMPSIHTLLRILTKQSVCAHWALHTSDSFLHTFARTVYMHQHPHVTQNPHKTVCLCTLSSPHTSDSFSHTLYIYISSRIHTLLRILTKQSVCEHWALRTLLTASPSRPSSGLRPASSPWCTWSRTLSSRPTRRAVSAADPLVGKWGWDPRWTSWSASGSWSLGGTCSWTSPEHQTPAPVDTRRSFF